MIITDGNLKDDGIIRKALEGLVGLFLLANLLVRFSTIFHYPGYNGYIAIFLGCVVLTCVFVVIYQKYLNIFLFIFGFSFFLFGFPSMDIQSRIFELILTCAVTSLFLINWRNKRRRHCNRPLMGFILCYVLLSLFSLLLLPVRQILKDFWLFGFKDFFFYVSIGQPYNIYYPIAAITRLALFAILAVQLAMLENRGAGFRSILTGLFSGAVFCAFLGLLDLYGILSLKWYRFGKTHTPGVLHSTFGNRGVFGEFVVTVVPFVLIGFMGKTKRIWIQLLLFGSLIICEVALILAGGRAGWVSFPLILSICWLFFYFLKEERFESFHFKWSDLVKVAISVPITILIGILLVYQVLMPLSDRMKTRDDTATSDYLRGQASRLIEPSKRGRLYTWAEGYHVGMEAPVYGVGYESFCRHAHILADTPESDLYKMYKGKKKHINYTPHSTFVQLFVSGGIVGFCLWVIAVVYAVAILLFDLVKNKRLFNIPVIISIISFHTFGIFQSMQYIPMVWSLIFINLGYALTVDEKVLPRGLQRVVKASGKVAIVLVMIGFFVYLLDFESRSLARKYDKCIYALDQERDRFSGFFQPSTRWKYGKYRWFSKKAVISLGEISDDGRRTTDEGRERSVELEFYCRTPGLEKEPVVLTVSYNGRVLDEVVFSGETGKKKGKKKKKAQKVRRKYELSVMPGEEEDLLLEVSRTWIPHEVLGNFDRRKLGVGVKVLKD